MGRILRAGFAVAATLGLALSVAVAAPQYGTAVVKKGQMSIARQGKATSYKASSKSIPVNEKDLVRVREGSEVELKTRDRATLVIGANAVFQCDPWKSSNRTGVFRMLFGRFRADVIGEAGAAGFNVKTRNATIGIKGTRYSLAESAAGNTAVLSLEHTVTVAGSDNREQFVNPGQMSVVIGDAGAGAAVTAPEEFKRDMASLASPRLGSPAALNLPAETVLVDRQIVNKEALEKSKHDKARVLGSGGAVDVPLPQLNLDDSDQAR